MFMKETLRALVGGAAVYVSMAACAGNIGDAPSRGAAGASSATGAAGATAGGSGGSSGLLDPVPSAQAQSGSRLKAIWFVSDDGSKMFTFRWYDSKLSQECSYTVVPSGALYCLPTAIAGTVTDWSPYVTGKYVTD